MSTNLAYGKSEDDSKAKRRLFGVAVRSARIEIKKSHESSFSLYGN